jgi:hypothetical protein
VASVAALIPDLLFGSNALALLRAGGHEAVLISSLEQLTPGAVEVLVVDLTADAPERLAQLEATDTGPARKLGVYAHVEADVRAAAQAAGFDVVVPRSRFMREGAALVSRLGGISE